MCCTVQLEILCNGSYQRSVGEEYNFGLGQRTVQKYIHKLKIKFPTRQEDHNRIKVEFLNRFPGTIGAIDGTHIAILKPTADEHNFINRKGFHSINRNYL